MKDLAFVKLAKGLIEKVKDKVAAKKQVWAQEAALSVEENKRREAEFKEDFKSVKERISSGSTNLKKSVETPTESVQKVQEKVKTVSAESVKNESVTKAPKAKPAVKKETQKEPKEAVKKSTAKKSTVKKTTKPKSEKSQAGTKTKKETKPK